ncbi:MAG: 23S rRNA (uracil(1939)-C(5))-methyltransferase RlmD [bacterium]|nr:23S rRNA (uracil(1939)-C(5))-methyltransferase RlmD [bacterium]
MKLKIEKLIYEGWGIGHDEKGMAIFVKKSVPGDILEVKIIKEKKTYAEAVIKKIIKPSLQRIEPPCPYFNLCGGCEHQNIDYADQLKFKDEIFRETLERAGIKTEILPIIQPSEPFYYRNSIRFFLIEKEDVQKVFTRHNYLYADGLVEAESCLLQSEYSNKILKTIAKTLNSSDKKLGSLYQVKIREGKATGDFMVELITDSDTLPFENELKGVLKKMIKIKSLYHTISYGRSPQNIKRRMLSGSPIIYEKIGKYTFQISPESFFQTNSLGVKTLYNKIKEFTDVQMGETVLDLFCGTGTIGIYLSTLAKDVVGIELVQSAINDANANAKINNIKNCEFVCADTNKWLSKNKTVKFDKIIVDPPRAGLSKDLIKLLSSLDFSLLTYISCNPATFARDIKEFESCGLKLKKVQPLDMFPQTHHLECVGIISKKV